MDAWKEAKRHLANISLYMLLSVAFTEIINLAWISLDKISVSDPFIPVKQMFMLQKIGFWFQHPTVKLNWMLKVNDPFTFILQCDGLQRTEESTEIIFLIYKW